MNRGYAFGFLIVLLVVALGLYVAYTGFQASRDALEAQATVPIASEGGMATRPPTRTAAAPTATMVTLPTPVAGITATLTAVGPLNPAETAAPGPAEPTISLPTQPPAPAATEPPPVPATEPPPAATPVSSPAYQFRVAGPPGPDPNDPNCCYIRGTVRDAAGNGLEGLLVKILNDWNRDLQPAVTKGGAEAGQYDIPIGRDAVTWYVMLVDAAGNQISSQVQIQINADSAGTYRVDWVRTY
ncbi:MAG TPA: hypothetical protein VLC52_02060 [Anaerolineae bacterium]|nr:hypothetical protein [Anaerolineae bacterium]